MQDSPGQNYIDTNGRHGAQIVTEKSGDSDALNEVFAALNVLKGSAEEEVRRLGRVECEMHQQVLDNRRRLDKLTAEFGTLRQLVPDLYTWKQGLENELNLLKRGVEDELHTAKQGLHDELERSTAQLQSELQSLTQDLGQQVRASTQELDLKLERLTVVVGTAAFFQRGSQGDAPSHTVSSVVNGHSDSTPQRSQTKAFAHESVNAETLHHDQEDAALSITDLYLLLKRLGLALKALKMHLAKTNKDVVQVRDDCSSECQALRNDLRRHEVTPAA